MRKCNYCELKFDIHAQYANHVRHNHKNTTVSKVKCNYCDVDVASYRYGVHLNKCALNPINIKSCKYCTATLLSIKSIFCNQKCSAKYNNAHRDRVKWSDTQRINFSKSQKIRKGKDKCDLYHITCCICNTIFVHHRKNRLTCSKECRNKRCSEVASAHPNCGGETNYKRYEYLGIIFDSSWEVKMAKYLDEHNIKWERSRKHLLYWIDNQGKKRRYYPDFYLPEYKIYLDPKNSYKLSKDLEKINYIKQYHKLLVGDVSQIISELGTCLKWFQDDN